MRIHVLSDLHNEFEEFKPDTVKCDVVILAGDVAPGEKGVTWINAYYPSLPSIYIAGNHEYYGHSIPRLTEKLRLACKDTSITFLECASVIIGGVRFLGCTLWSDFDITGNRAASMDAAQAIMADYKRIRVSPQYRKLRPIDTKSYHHYSNTWLTEQVKSSSEPVVIITHHAPSVQSLKPGSELDHISGAYASNLEPLIEAGNIKLWIHGHTHHCVDYLIGSTRVLSNQRGYPDEPAEGFRNDLVVEI